MKRRTFPSTIASVLASSLLFLTGCYEVGFLYDGHPKPSAPLPMEQPLSVSQWAPDSHEARFNLAPLEGFLRMPQILVPPVASQSQPITLGFVYQPDCHMQRFEVRVDEVAKIVYIAAITSDRRMVCGGLAVAPRWAERRFTPQATGTYLVTTVVSSHSYRVDVQ